MKCTLRQTEQGVVATIDEAIKEGDIFIHSDLTIERASRDLDGRGLHKIIASTFGAGKELVIPTKTNLGAVIFENICDGSEFTYNETETQIIIQL